MLTNPTETTARCRISHSEINLIHLEKYILACVHLLYDAAHLLYDAAGWLHLLYDAAGQLSETLKFTTIQKIKALVFPICGIPLKNQF